jgi:hypothetical protein
MKRIATVIGMCLMVGGLALVAQEYHYPKAKTTVAFTAQQSDTNNNETKRAKSQS